MSDSQLEFIFHGHGSPMLLLHGWGGDARTLNLFSGRLAPYRQVWSLSLPGFGASPEPPEVWGSAEYAAAVAKWMLSNGLARTEIIAHSFGGRVAIQLAAEYPAMVKSMVLIASPGLPAPQTVNIWARKMAAKGIKSAAKFAFGRMKRRLMEHRERFGSADWRAATPLMRGVLSRVIREDLSPQMKRITIPCALIYGEKDRAVPPQIGRRMAQIFPNARFHQISRAGHYPFLDAPGEVMSVVFDFLNLPRAW